MSIASEISRIQQNVSDSLAAVANKGVTVPLGSNSDDLAGLIAQIPNNGVSVVRTQDSHGGDIVTITAEQIEPWVPWGKGAELIQTYDMGTTTLSQTSYNSWAPSSTAGSIKGTSNLGTITSSALNTYEYAIKTVFESNTAYVSGTTMEAAVTRQIVEAVQIIHRKPNTLANIASKTDGGNYCTTNFTAQFWEYYNKSGTFTWGWSGGYGFYPSLTAATFSSSTGASPTITIKAPAYYVRCNSSYFSTTVAPNVDQNASTIKCKVYVYRYQKAGSMMYNMYREICDVYNL